MRTLANPAPLSCTMNMMWSSKRVGIGRFSRWEMSRSQETRSLPSNYNALNPETEKVKSSRYVDHTMKTRPSVELSAKVGQQACAFLALPAYSRLTSLLPVHTNVLTRVKVRTALHYTTHALLLFFIGWVIWLGLLVVSFFWSLVVSIGHQLCLWRYSSL